MSKRENNIYHRKDNRWEGRYFPARSKKYKSVYHFLQYRNRVRCPTGLYYLECHLSAPFLSVLLVLQAHYIRIE